MRSQPSDTAERLFGAVKNSLEGSRSPLHPLAAGGCFLHLRSFTREMLLNRSINVVDRSAIETLNSIRSRSVLH